MTGVSPFLFFHKHTIITIKDATLMSQSFTSMDAGTQTIDKGTHTVTIDTVTGMYHSKPKDDKDVSEYIEGKDYTWIYDHDGNWVRYWHASHRIDRDVPRYPEPEGDPSY